MRGGGGAAGRWAHRPETGGGGMWRGGRGKAERARGRAGSEKSGESVGKWIMINTCIWFQWLPGRLEKAPAGLQWGGSSEQRERESPTAEEEQTTTEEARRSFVYVLILLFYFVLLNTLFLARHPWLPRPSFPDPRTALQYAIYKNLYLYINKKIQTVQLYKYKENIVSQSAGWARV